MARRKNNLLRDNPPPGGLEETGTAVKIRAAPPQSPPLAPAAAAELRKDKLKKRLQAQVRQNELNKVVARQGDTEGQGSVAAKRRVEEEEEARKFRKGRAA